MNKRERSREDSNTKWRRFKQVWICHNLFFHTKKMKKKNLKVKKYFKWKSGKIKRRFQYKMRRSKQVWICSHLFFHTKKMKKKKFKSEKIF